jgi:hypothetical protein
MAKRIFHPLRSSHLSRLMIAAWSAAALALVGILLAGPSSADSARHVVEAETFTSRDRGIIPRSSVSAGRVLAYYSNGSASESVRLPGPATSLTVRARGRQCEGAPQATVLLDGIFMVRFTVSSTSYADYSYTPTTPVAAGLHTLTVRFANDYLPADKNCDRNLHVDKVTFSVAGGTDTTTQFSFTAAGDHGFSTAAMDVVKNSGSRFYLALGDLSYTADGERAWCSEFKSRFNDVEVLAGSHDSGESEGGHIDNYVVHCPFTLSGLNGAYGKQYYFDYPASAPLARFIMIAPGVKGSLNIDYSAGGEGYSYTKNAIADARARNIPWIIVGMHKNCVSMGVKTCEVGTDIMNLLIAEKVDLVLQSHDHNFQRTHALRCIQVNAAPERCLADDGSDGTYARGRGSVIVINGEFGVPLYEVDATDPEAAYFAAWDSTSFGVSKYTITETSITSRYLVSNQGSFTDSFTIQ